MQAMPNYTETAAPQLQPRRQPKTTAPRPRIKGATWTIQDKAPYFVALALVVFMAVAMIFFSNAASSAKRETASIAAQTERVQNANSTAKQQISDLTSANRLNQIAQKNGLNMVDSSIRNIK